MNSAYLRDQSAGGGIFGDKSLRAGREGLFHEAPGTVLSEKDNFDVRAFMLDQPRGFKAANDRHRDVHENEIWIVLFGEADGVSSIGRLANDFNIGVHPKNLANRSSDNVAVVYDQDTQGG